MNDLTLIYLNLLNRAFNDYTFSIDYKKTGKLYYVAKACVENPKDDLPKKIEGYDLKVI